MLEARWRIYMGGGPGEGVLAIYPGRRLADDGKRSDALDVL